VNQSARVSSIDALAAFRVALLKFADDAMDGLTGLRLESRRGAEWVEVDRVRYWPAQARKASDDVNSARINLERCELAVRAEDRRSCYDEKKALERAKQRVRLCDEKVRTTKKWARVVVQEARDFLGELSKLEHFLDSDLPRAVAILEKMIASLSRYAETTTSLDQAPPPSSIDAATTNKDVDKPASDGGG